MFEFIKFLQKRPKDSTIIAIRIILGLLLIGVLYYNFFGQTDPNQVENELLFGNVNISGYENIAKYSIIGLGIFPLIFGLARACFFKKKIVRILQIVFAVLLFYSSSMIVDVANLDIDTLLLLVGIYYLFAGITGKCITSKCLKYGEKIQKIRV